MCDITLKKKKNLKAKFKKIQYYLNTASRRKDNFSCCRVVALLSIDRKCVANFFSSSHVCDVRYFQGLTRSFDNNFYD